jgi:hypothetical protein
MKNIKEKHSLKFGFGFSTADESQICRSQATLVA